jgi:hypothetical protein
VRGGTRFGPSGEWGQGMAGVGRRTTSWAGSRRIPVGVGPVGRRRGPQQGPRLGLSVPDEGDVRRMARGQSRGLWRGGYPYLTRVVAGERPAGQRASEPQRALRLRRPGTKAHAGQAARCCLDGPGRSLLSRRAGPLGVRVTSTTWSRLAVSLGRLVSHVMYWSRVEADHTDVLRQITPVRCRQQSTPVRCRQQSTPV